MGTSTRVRNSGNPASDHHLGEAVHRGAGRVYGLDLGQDHHNPEAYPPGDITASLDDPVEVWRQFCGEARITHHGALEAPPAEQEEVPL